MAWGQPFERRVDYAVGVFNGEINGDLDTNDRKDVAARFVVAPFAANADGAPPVAAITATPARTNSAASSGSRW